MARIRQRPSGPVGARWLLYNVDVRICSMARLQERMWRDRVEQGGGHHRSWWRAKVRVPYPVGRRDPGLIHRTVWWPPLSSGGTLRARGVLRASEGKNLPIARRRALGPLAALPVSAWERPLLAPPQAVSTSGPARVYPAHAPAPIGAERCDLETGNSGSHRGGPRDHPPPRPRPLNLPPQCLLARCALRRY
jgi:hypothetical protein